MGRCKEELNTRAIGCRETAYRYARLPHRSPQEETAKGRAVEQNGLSLLLPRGILRAWKSYQRR